MNALFRGLVGSALLGVTSLAGAQPANNRLVDAAPAAAARGAVVATSEPAPIRTVSPTPQDREILPEAEPERHWYGWQNLSLDGGVIALALAAAAVDSSGSASGPQNSAQAMLLGAALGYGAGGPAIHLIHHHPWQALGSLGLRGGLPVLGGAIGLASATCPPPGGGDYGDCGLGQLILGAAAGAVIAIAIDDGLLAWEKPSRDEVARARFGLSPVVSSDGRRELRVFGTF